LGWTGDTATRDALLRLTRDSSSDVQLIAVEGLASGWAGDAAARDALLHLIRHDTGFVRKAAEEGLTKGWPKDASVRDALDLHLTRHKVALPDAEQAGEGN
jgi:HEAT repeat protein